MDQYQPTFLGSVLKAIACTPNRNPSDSEFQERVIEPAREIRRLWKELADRNPSEDQIRNVMKLLIRALDTKHVDPEERDERIREILDRCELHHLFPDLLTIQGEGARGEPPAARVPQTSSNH